MLKHTTGVPPRCTSRTPEAWITIRKGPWRSWIPRSLATVRRKKWGPPFLFGGHVWVFLYKTPETYFTIFYIYACCMQFEFGLPNLVGFQSFLVPPTFPLSCQTFQQFSHVRPSIRMVDSVDGTMFYHICQVHALSVLKQQLLLKLTAIGL